MDEIARFSAHLTNEKHASQNTVSSYLRDTTQFAGYLHNHYGIGLLEADSAPLGESEQKLVQTVASFLGRQMEG